MKTLKALLLLAIVLSVDHSVTADPIPDHSSAEVSSVNNTIHKPEDSMLGDTIGDGSSNHSVPEATADPINPNPELSDGLAEFAHVIICEAGKDSIVPLADYTDYGCYCGFGGKGNPVDDLDRCCQVHDECYGVVQKHPKCNYFFLKSAVVPYLNTYDYTCDQETNKAKCSETNDECQMVLCECDRKAAECFAESPYNSWNHKLNQTLCE